MEVTVASTKGALLEALCYRHASPTRSCSILVVHQYSLLGGNMDLMTGITRRLHLAGFNATTFNCRGVGNSTGRATISGKEEINDVLSVADWMRENLNQDVVVVGSSAGAPIAGSAVHQRDWIVGFVAIGYTFGRLTSLLFGSHFNAILTCSKPKLFIMGSLDGFTSESRLRAKLKDASGVNQVEIIENVGHFDLEGSRFDTKMSQLIVNFISSL